jgi:hypothetical protein
MVTADAVRVAHASRVLVSASRRNNLFQDVVWPVIFVRRKSSRSRGRARSEPDWRWRARRMRYPDCNWPDTKIEALLWKQTSDHD